MFINNKVKLKTFIFLLISVITTIFFVDIMYAQNTTKNKEERLKQKQLI